MDKTPPVLSLNRRFARYDHLGSDYPYFYAEVPENLYADMASAATGVPLSQRMIDPVGIVELLSRGYMLGQRTLLAGLQKAPWRARPDGRGGWQYAEVPDHGFRTMPTADLVKNFKAAVEKEALSYLVGLKRIGILLSGGMDSRIVAGIVRELQLRGDYTGEVVGLTWGVHGCRDVVYSTQVVKRFDWDRAHFELTPEQLRENIQITGKMGAEFAPFHLHALPRVAEMGDLDAVLGGSYGDSVGRGEYSGVHLESLRPTVAKDLNPYGLVRESVVRAARSKVLADAYAYRRHLSREHEYQYREIEYQMHCIRRRTQAVVSWVGRRIPFYQLFTSPEVFGLVWGVDPALRDARIYKGLLAALPGQLGEIPWARTGKKFGVVAGETDQLAKEHHRYGHWLRNDLHQEVSALVDSDAIRGLGVFNEATLDRLLKLWPQAKTLTINNLDENMSWLASLSVYVQHYQLQPIAKNDAQLRDCWNTVAGLCKAWSYQVARERLRA